MSDQAWQQGQQGSPSNVPIPDPSTRTNELVVQLVSAERDYVDGKLEVVQQRFVDIDRATALLNEQVTHVPTDVDKQVGHLKEVMVEKFESVGTQFKERDTRSERESRDNKVAVDAAFAAQKEAAAKQDEGNLKAIDKSERATAETIKTLSDSSAESLKTLSDLFRTNIAALSDKVDDLKERIVSSDTRNTTALSNLDAKTSAEINVIDLKISTLTAMGGGRAAGTDQAGREADRNRYAVFGVISAVIALITVVSILFIGLRKTPTSNPTPSVSCSVAVAGQACVK